MDKALSDVAALQKELYRKVRRCYSLVAPVHLVNRFQLQAQERANFRQDIIHYRDKVKALQAKVAGNPKARPLPDCGMQLCISEPL
jgi:hypothetical protein